MTRFTDKRGERITGLSRDDFDRLCGTMRHWVQTYASVIERERTNCQKNSESYRLMELTPSIVVSIRRAERRAFQLHVGYPFPLASTRDYRLARALCAPKYQVHVYLRGEMVRRLQRAWMRKFLSNAFQQFEWKSIGSLAEFRRVVASGIIITRPQRRHWLAVDPYSFLGDAVVQLYFVERLARKFGGAVTVFSNAYQHISAIHHARALDEIRKYLLRADIVLVLPDLIDNHFGRTIRILKLCQDATVSVLVIGRNLFLRIENKACKAYHLQARDVLLRDRPIDVYMRECLGPFLELLVDEARNYTPHVACSQGEELRLLVNPFASTYEKELSPSTCAKILQELGSHGAVEASVSIGAGPPAKRQWVEALRSLVCTQIGIKTLYDTNLTDLSEQLLRLHINCAVSTDTGLSHLLSKLGISVVIWYNEAFWDSTSLQSLSAESALSFCRPMLPQYPAILHNGSAGDALPSNIAGSLRILATGRNVCLQLSRSESFNRFFGDLKGGLEFLETVRSPAQLHRELYAMYTEFRRWHAAAEIYPLFGIYDPDAVVTRVLSRFPVRSRYFVSSAWANVPVYKLLRLNSKQAADS